MRPTSARARSLPVQSNAANARQSLTWESPDRQPVSIRCRSPAGACRGEHPLLERDRVESDDRTMYLCESFANVIHAYKVDADSGEIENRRAFVTNDPDSGTFPNGITVGADGFVRATRLWPPRSLRSGRTDRAHHRAPGVAHPASRASPKHHLQLGQPFTPIRHRHLRQAPAKVIEDC